MAGLHQVFQYPSVSFSILQSKLQNDQGAGSEAASTAVVVQCKAPRHGKNALAQLEYRPQISDTIVINFEVPSDGIQHDRRGLIGHARSDKEHKPRSKYLFPVA